MLSLWKQENSMKNTILEILELNHNKHISGELIAQSLNMTRANVWKEIQKLKNEGMVIESIRNLGYKLTDYGNNLSESLILTTCPNLTGVKVLESVDSTNNFAKTLAKDNTDYLIIANQQTHGKGRMGRSFFSPDKHGVYMSLILKPDLQIGDVQLTTICAALALTQALESLYKLSPKIKWLNDVYIGNRKVSGILTEGEIELNHFAYLVVGIGINTHSVVDLPKEIEGVYTALDREVDRNELISTTINNFYKLYKDLPHNRYALIDAYKLHSNVLGKTITIKNQGDDRYLAEDISSEGHLIVVDNFGKRIELNSGEISVSGTFHEN